MSGAMDDFPLQLDWRRLEEDSERSDVAARAERSEAGAWSEGLSQWHDGHWKLPGQGGRGSRCGEWYPKAVCKKCGEPDFGTHLCSKRSCPGPGGDESGSCWAIWAQEAGVRATQRIQAFRYTQPDDYRRQVAHGVVSPPEGTVMNARQYWNGRSKAAEIAQQKGWRGFAVIPHPFRVTDEGQERYEEEDPEYGIWVWLRNDVEKMFEYIYWSPHYHIIGFTSADMTAAREDDDWTYHFLRSLEHFDGVRDRDSHEDLYGLFRYLLSHTGYPEESTKQVTTWYGDLANSVFVEDATEDWQHQKPSKGILSSLKREIEEVAGKTEDDESDGSGGGESDDRGDCPVEGCDGVLIGVFDIQAYLRQAQPPPEVEKVMIAAWEWRSNMRHPPPGLKRPQSEEDAREAFIEMSDYDGSPPVPPESDLPPAGPPDDYTPMWRDVLGDGDG